MGSRENLKDSGRQEENLVYFKGMSKESLLGSRSSLSQTYTDSFTREVTR